MDYSGVEVEYKPAALNAMNYWIVAPDKKTYGWADRWENLLTAAKIAGYNIRDGAQKV